MRLDLKTGHLNHDTTDSAKYDTLVSLISDFCGQVDQHVVHIYTH